MPPHVWHAPLPWHAEHGESYLNASKVPGISSAGIFPFPWQTAQFPSPAESQSGQVWVAILHLPTVSAIMVWFRFTVKRGQDPNGRGGHEDLRAIAATLKLDKETENIVRYAEEPEE